jgi:hypothetical protein
MADMFKKSSQKDFWHGVSCGDGWNSWDYGHTKRRTEGRKKIKRKARNKLKQDLRKEIDEY